MNKIQDKNASLQQRIIDPELIIRESCGTSTRNKSAENAGRKRSLIAAAK